MRIPGEKTLLRHRCYWRGRFLGGGVILGYHRVAHDPEDPHLLCVRPSHFQEHLEVISRHFQVVSLEELVRNSGATVGRETSLDGSDAHGSAPHGSGPDRRPSAGSTSKSPQLGNGRRLLALTFDDGYTDVLNAALPCIEDRAMPVTVFVVAGAVGMDRFHWDSGRGGLEGRPLSREELGRLASRPGVEIGAHTLSHPDLTTLSPPEARLQIAEGRDRLEALLHRPVLSFSYPHGGVNRPVQRAVSKSRFQLACASRPGLVTRSSDPLRLPRFWPPDAPGPVFERWLASWTGIRPGDGSRGRSSAVTAATSTEGDGP